jgi:transposase
MKVLVHDGIGVWLAARRLNSGSSFVWPHQDAALDTGDDARAVRCTRTRLPWQRLGEAGIITVL